MGRRGSGTHSADVTACGQFFELDLTSMKSHKKVLSNQMPRELRGWIILAIGGQRLEGVRDDAGVGSCGGSTR